jgi:hypothetical protein
LLREDVAGGTAADGTCGREGEALGAVTAAAEAFLKEPSFGDGVVAGLDGGETADGLLGLALGTEGVLNVGELACCCDCGWAGFGVAGEKEENGDDADAARALKSVRKNYKVLWVMENPLRRIFFQVLLPQYLCNALEFEVGQLIPVISRSSSTRMR